MNTTLIENDSRLGCPSASGMYRLAQCPGSWLAERMCPVDVESDDAAVGTYLHGCMEKGETPEDPEQAEVIECCKQLEQELVEEIFGDAALKVIREERMFVSGDEECEVLFSGMPDVVYYSPLKDVALILDYKFGRLAVDSVEKNRQLAALAVLLKHKMGNCPAEVYAGIIQPYVSRRKPQLVKFLPNHLDDAEVYLKRVIAEAETPNAPLRPDEKACRYCRAKASCPAVSMALVSVTSGDLTGAWESWTPSKKREAYDLAKLAKKWAASVEAKLKADLKADMEIPGLTLAPGKKAFTVTDPAKAFVVLNGLFPDGIGAAEFTAICKVGITDLDKLVHSVRKAQGLKTTVSESKEWLRKTLEGCAETKVSEGSVKEIGGAE